jgi:hypothetical protein
MPIAPSPSEFAGDDFEYAFADAGGGRYRHQLSPGLTVAINWCDYSAGRITHEAIAE